MANKRKAQEAFGQLSAFAAARKAKQPPSEKTTESLATAIAAEPYEGQDDDNEAGDSSSLVNERLPSIQLSDVKANSVKEKGADLEISLFSGQSATCVGEYHLTVTAGLVSIYGAILHPGSGAQRVSALATSALPAIMARKDGTVVRLTSVQSKITDLAKYSPLFRNIGASSNSKGRSFELLSNTSEDGLERSLWPLEIDEDFRKVLSRISARLEAREVPKIMAVGPKSSGKSTLNRLLCNLITTRPGGQHCLYLDLDPGQPEFGPPGQVSLVEVSVPVLGPPYTHPASIKSKQFRLVRAHTLAATSFKDDPELYTRCAIDLLKHASRKLPLVVNSCGWVTGLGAATIAQLIHQVQITDAIILQPPDSQLERDLRSEVTTHIIPRRPCRSQAKTPAGLRAMQSMAYFHHRYSVKEESIKWTTKSLGDFRPWLVSYAGPNSAIAAILSYGQAPHPEFLSEVIDGMVVAIVVPDPDLLDPSTVERTPGDLPYVISQTDSCSSPLDPARTQCIGLALIRGVDVQEKKLHLVTPLGEPQIAGLLQKQIALVRGNFDPPDWAYLEDTHANNKRQVEQQPWVDYSEAVGIEGSVWRLRHPPMSADVRKV